MKENGLTEKRFTALLVVVMICITSIILTRNDVATPIEPVSNTTRFALAALLSVDGSRAWWNQQKYISSAEKLAISFRRHSNLDMVLLVVDEYGLLRKSDEERLRNSGWSVHHMRFEGITVTNGRFFSKLWMWRLLMYELILYTDLDTLFVESPEVIFHLRPSSQNPAMVLDTAHTHYFNTGVMLLRPSESEFQRLVTAFNTHESRMDYTEQYFLNYFYHGRIITLHARFNRQVCAQDNCLNDKISKERFKRPLDETALRDTTTILHFNGDNKPWDLKNCMRKNIVQLCMFWKHYQ